MVRPGDRCEFDYEPDSDIFKPYSCYREAWRDGRCLWHARVKGKPGKLLRQSRIVGAFVSPSDSRDRWVGSGGERLDQAILREADLREVSFADCTLFGADLTEAVLVGTDLSNADLRKSSLQGATARRALLGNAILREANLAGADLQGADLSNADLQRADLSGVDLGEANLSGADLRKADLSDADLQGADLPGANLHGADLTRADLIECELRGANLETADATSAYAMRADLNDARLSAADLSKADLERASLSDAVLRGTTMTGANLLRADLTDADATEADFVRTVLERARLSRADLLGADLRDARFYGAALGGVEVDDRTEFGEYNAYDPAREAGSGDGDGADVDSDDESGNASDDESGDVSDGENGDSPAEGVDVADLDPETRDRKAAGTYRSLERLARENERPDLRVRGYLRRKDVERARLRRTGRYSAWLRSVGTNLLTRYGESPWRVIGAGVLVVLVCGALYPLGLIRLPGAESALWYPDGARGILLALAEGLQVSAAAFTTTGTGHEVVGAGRVLATLESLVGPVLFALLVFTLARRATR